MLCVSLDPQGQTPPRIGRRSLTVANSVVVYSFNALLCSVPTSSLKVGHCLAARSILCSFVTCLRPQSPHPSPPKNSTPHTTHVPIIRFLSYQLSLASEGSRHPCGCPRTPHWESRRDDEAQCWRKFVWRMTPDAIDLNGIVAAKNLSSHHQSQMSTTPPPSSPSPTFRPSSLEIKSFNLYSQFVWRPFFSSTVLPRKPNVDDDIAVISVIFFQWIVVQFVVAF